MSSSSSSSSPIRSWRTAFLTVRDETTLASTPPGPTVIDLLDQLIFSQSDSLIAAAPQLPPHEVMSDFMLLLELARKVSSNSQGIEDTFFIKLSHLIHGISHCSRFQMNSMSWALLLGSSQSIVPFFLNTAKTKSSLIGNPAVIKATRQYLETIRCLFGLYQTAVSLSEHEQLLSVVLQIVDCSQGESIHLSYLTDKYNVSGGVWEVLAVAFSMISEVYSSVGASLAVEIWQSTIEVLRKVMDILASKNFLLENTIIAMFYIELLHCLHLVLREPRGHLADHVAGFVAALKIFFCYGLTNKSLVMKKSKEVSSTSKTPQFEVPKKSRSGPYRPPHLRNKVVPNQHNKDNGPLVSPKHEFTSSDSECSDNDGSMTDNSGYCFAKARLAAITCIQDLCRVDPKLFTSQWTMLLPSSDVLLQRKNETTLMSCLLFDPYVKVRIAAGSTIMSMLDGPASVSLRVAEFRGRSRAGSFTALSSSLGDILMQLHSGTLHLIKHETDTRLLGLSFKILMLLISSTPYSRMSEELLPMVLSSIQSRIDLGFSFQSDPVSLLSTVINCLTLALSVSPCSTSVNDMLMREVSTGSMEGRQRSGVLYTLFRYSEQLSSPSISLEAFQALKAVAHNYPSVISLCWEQISSIVYGALFASSDIPVRSWKGNVEPTVEPMKERLIAAAIKVLDECLRAISGFKGTEDLSNDKFLESPFTSDCVKTKAISSAPSYSLESPISVNGESETFLLASERWSEVTTKHMPIINKHPSAMIRAASVTCFAGMTSSVFLSLTKDKQEFITSSLTDAALNDGVPSVRSAACRAIGVIAFFPQIYHSTDVLEKFIHAVEHNALDSLLSVRITAAWALANICDSLGHCMDAPGTETRKLSQFISLLFDNALRLTRDNDKVKANAVRALGNLSRFIQLAGRPIQHGDLENLVHLRLERDGAKAPKREMLDSFPLGIDSFPLGPSESSNWLDQMVQAFVSCVTTGNVKVQWNVCHALSNLFSNKTLKLQDKDWGSSVFSILLLLLRDSSNFKIRIQAAAALAVPQALSDYGRSYYDVVKGVEHVVENFKSDQISEPSNFKYWIALEKQLTSTMLHLLGLAASCDHRAIQDLLTKKASFLEVWIKDLCASLGDTTYSHGEAKQLPSVDQKKDVLLETIRSLVRVYENSNQHLIADKFERLANGLR